MRSVGKSDCFEIPFLARGFPGLTYPDLVDLQEWPMGLARSRVLFLVTMSYSGTKGIFGENEGINRSREIELSGSGETALTVMEPATVLRESRPPKHGAHCRQPCRRCYTTSTDQVPLGLGLSASWQSATELDRAVLSWDHWVLAPLVQTSIAWEYGVESSSP